ncbi:hypothetical protein RJ55_04944 [Drechmeria coniospora]|nr:hypothetical protein RJ55_04944 [Drechmeria coniospora]
MKTVYRFAPSKRSYQHQFRRWEFPGKMRPRHHKNDELVRRVKELWEKNISQREMLRILTEDDGFDIRNIELSRLRSRFKLLLRSRNGDKQRLAEEDMDDDESATDSPPSPQHAPGTAGARQHPSRPGGGRKSVGKRSMRKSTTVPSGMLIRYPSETTLTETRRILNLDTNAYWALRTNFHRICQEEGVSKKTLAGETRWEALKNRLIQESPHLRSQMSAANGAGERKKLALDIVCTDVTKRLRSLESRMTLVEAKMYLEINPEETRQMRAALHKVLCELGLTTKIETTPDQWEDVKQRWGKKSAVAQRILDNAASDAESQKKIRALDFVAKDVLKRLRDDERGRKQGKQSSLPSAINPRQPIPHDTPMDVPRDVPKDVDDSAYESFEVPGASSPLHMSFASPPRMTLAMQSMSSSASPCGPPPIPTLGSGATLVAMGSPTASPLGFGANPPASFVNESLLAAARSAPPFQHTAPSAACAVYLRLHPSSGIMTDAGLWVATLGSHSVEEVRRAAAERIPGAVCVLVEGILKDGKGCELPLPIADDDQLSAYMSHLQGAAPTLSVRLVWKE